MRRALAFLVGLVLALVLVEGAVRLAWDEERWLWELTPRQVSDVEVHQLSEDPALIYELRPGASEVLDGPFGDRQVSVNALGFRGEPPGEGFRIACLGGSNTFGAAVSDHETWPARLAEELGVEVMNLGVHGYMTRQKVALDLEPLAPDLVLLQIYNEGRRFVLEGTLLESYARFPELWSENFAGPRPPLASGRLAVLGLNRIFQDDIVQVRTDLAALEDRAALKDFLERSEVPVVLVYPPAGGSDAATSGLGLEAIDLSEHDNPFGAAGLDIHPPAEVYRWYAEVIARELRRRGHVEVP